MTEWIDVKKELPTFEDYVLVTDCYRIDIGYLKDTSASEIQMYFPDYSTPHQWILDYGFEPTHWMPLPEMPITERRKQ